MSLTQNEMVYLGALEQAANVVLQAICTARPRYLSLSSLIPQNTSTVTQVAAVGPYDWTADSGMPRVDLFPATNWNVQAPPFGIGQFGIHAEPVKIDVISSGTSLGAYAVVVAITGQVVLAPNFPGYKLVFSTISAQALDLDPNSPVPALVLGAMTYLLNQFISGLGPIEMPLPSLAIGPIVPAGGPIVDLDKFMLTGSL